MTRWHTYNRRRKRHVSKKLWRFTQLLEKLTRSLKELADDTPN